MFCMLSWIYHRTLDKHQIKRWRAKHCLSIVLENNRCTGFVREGQLSWRLEGLWFWKMINNPISKKSCNFLFLYVYRIKLWKWKQESSTNKFMKSNVTKTSSNKKKRVKSLEWHQKLNWQYLSNIFLRRARIDIC